MIHGSPSYWNTFFFYLTITEFIIFCGRDTDHRLMSIPLEGSLTPKASLHMKIVLSTTDFLRVLKLSLCVWMIHSEEFNIQQLDFKLVSMSLDFWRISDVAGISLHLYNRQGLQGDIKQGKKCLNLTFLRLYCNLRFDFTEVQGKIIYKAVVGNIFGPETH